MHSTLTDETVRVGYEKYMKNFVWETSVKQIALKA
jgi:hypothetical protein